ncbi:hypothetical protein PV04_06276 [Phialophora macrospora]|uniref:Heterokaryon incompatibility domain-containing protein n=1 Tax=Phialophora macrospora TaxID=1851006 RepID=A0A0D2FG27_9EURO|nr:hypothetical protein PV04_06276 [Phialophora macrospora]
MAAHFGANYERHPMVAPIWQKLETIEQQLDHLDSAVNAILKHLNITLPGTDSNADRNASTTSETEGPPTTEVSDEPYEYKSLDSEKAEIRVLALNNASEEIDVITGSLVHLSLEDQRSAGWKRYNALSYTWGEPKMDRRIVIDGHPFFVTQNLESALRQMRKTASKAAASTPRGAAKQTFWWIDQICINQADLEERGSQVSLMRRIYKSASSVQVWLGDAVEGSALAMDLAVKIGRPPPRGPGQKEVVYPGFGEDEVRQHWQSLRLLLSQPWWERCWIRQEVSLGSGGLVFWGEHGVGLDVISQAAMAIEYADSLGHRLPGAFANDPEQNADDKAIKFDFYHHAKGLRTLRKHAHAGHSFLPLPELLLHARYCSATDLRDKVYSMLGLADPEIYPLRADYRLSLPEVLKSAARVILPSKKGLRLLGACQNHDRRHDLPSWVPNLIDGWKYHPFEPDDARHFISTAEPSVEFDNDTMLVKALIFDSVGQICETVVPGNPTIGQLDEVYEAWQHFAEEALDAGHLEESRAAWSHGVRKRKDLFWLDFLSTERMATIVLRYSDDDKTVLLPEREEGLKLEYMGLNLRLAESYLLPESTDSNLHPLRRIRAALKKYGVGRRLGLCAERKTLVLLPGDVQPGDEVAIFRGATFPYLLRKVPSDDGVTEQCSTVLVGEAFLPEEGVNQAVSLAYSTPSANVIRIV